VYVCQSFILFQRKDEARGIFFPFPSVFEVAAAAAAGIPAVTTMVQVKGKGREGSSKKKGKGLALAHTHKKMRVCVSLCVSLFLSVLCVFVWKGGTEGGGDDRACAGAFRFLRALVETWMVEVEKMGSVQADALATNFWRWMCDADSLFYDPALRRLCLMLMNKYFHHMGGI
jgi:hypothetical protein